ncbi:hypothetical protein AB0N61_00375 [Microbacterium sp. NPDC089320]|uniref:hypothetical protein n=1 Tax=Microbacterium sp. NPDC089320 TaxID=3155182 RepID=UPI00344581C3
MIRTHPTEDLTVEFRGQPATVPRAHVLQAAQAASLLSFVLGVLPSRAERHRLGIESQADALEFMHALRASIDAQPDAADLQAALRDGLGGPLAAAGVLPRRQPHRRRTQPSRRRRRPRTNR